VKKNVDDRGSTLISPECKIESSDTTLAVEMGTIHPRIGVGNKGQCHFCGFFGIIVNKFPRRGYGNKNSRAQRGCNRKKYTLRQRREWVVKKEEHNRMSIFYIEDLPNMGSGMSGFLYGFTLYRGVVVQWDRDQDKRIFVFINELPAMVRGKLAIVQEHEGSIGLVWYANVPYGYEEGNVFEVEGDYWVIEKSIERKRTRF